MDFTVSLTAAQICAMLGFSVGFLWGEAFSSFDQQIKYNSEWFRRLTPFQQWFVSSLLDAFHHFQYGLALMLLALTVPCPSWLPAWFNTLVLWVGWGLVVSDWKDYRNVFKRLGLSLKESAEG